MAPSLQIILFLVLISAYIAKFVLWVGIVTLIFMKKIDLATNIRHGIHNTYVLCCWFHSQSRSYQTYREWPTFIGRMLGK